MGPAEAGPRGPRLPKMSKTNMGEGQHSRPRHQGMARTEEVRVQTPRQRRAENPSPIRCQVRSGQVPYQVFAFSVFRHFRVSQEFPSHEGQSVRSLEGSMPQKASRLHCWMGETRVSSQGPWAAKEEQPAR